MDEDKMPGSVQFACYIKTIQNKHSKGKFYQELNYIFTTYRLEMDWVGNRERKPFKSQAKEMKGDGEVGRGKREEGLLKVFLQGGEEAGGAEHLRREARLQAGANVWVFFL